MSQLTNLKKAQAKLLSEREDLARREKLLKRQTRELSARVARDAERLVGRAWFELMKTGRPVDTETLIATATELAYVNEADGLLKVIDLLKPHDGAETGTGPEYTSAPSADPEFVPSPPLDAEGSESLAPKPQPVAAPAPAPLPSRRQFGTSLQNSSSAAAPPELDGPGAGVGNAKT